MLRCSRCLYVVAAAAEATVSAEPSTRLPLLCSVCVSDAPRHRCSACGVGLRRAFGERCVRCWLAQTLQQQRPRPRLFLTREERSALDGGFVCMDMSSRKPRMSPTARPSLALMPTPTVSTVATAASFSGAEAEAEAEAEAFCTKFRETALWLQELNAFDVVASGNGITDLQRAKAAVAAASVVVVSARPRAAADCDDSAAASAAAALAQLIDAEDATAAAYADPAVSRAYDTLAMECMLPDDAVLPVRLGGTWGYVHCPTCGQRFKDVTCTAGGFMWQRDMLRHQLAGHGCTFAPSSFCAYLIEARLGHATRLALKRYWQKKQWADDAIAVANARMIGRMRGGLTFLSFGT